jgi:hypothetical protein
VDVDDLAIVPEEFEGGLVHILKGEIANKDLGRWLRVGGGAGDGRAIAGLDPHLSALHL